MLFIVNILLKFFYNRLIEAFSAKKVYNVGYIKG